MNSNLQEWPWLTFKQSLIRDYGQALFRVPIDPGWSCPNREADGRGGCTFCAEHGSKAQQSMGIDAPREQAERGMHFARERYGAEGFILYLQSYTATHTSTRRLRELVTELLPLGPFRMLALGTRPDCLSTATVGMLRQWNETVDVSLELGVQTSHDRTLERIHRGHDWACSEQAIATMHAEGLRPVPHVILGLPGESEPDMLATIDRLCALPIHGIKFHNLHVLRGTQLEREYRAAPFPLFDEREYANLLIECIRRIPAHLPIHRISTDSPADELVAPQWGMKKGQFLEMVAKRMRTSGWRQGDLDSS